MFFFLCRQKFHFISNHSTYDDEIEMRKGKKKKWKNERYLKLSHTRKSIVQYSLSSTQPRITIYFFFSLFYFVSVPLFWYWLLAIFEDELSTHHWVVGFSFVTLRHFITIFMFFVSRQIDWIKWKERERRERRECGKE